MNTVDALLPDLGIEATAARLAITVGGPLDTRAVRFCPQCKLVYEPDPRIYTDAHERCPKCGYKLIKDDSYG
jgi:hypothetical protein